MGISPGHIVLPDIELVSAKVHDAWVQTKLSQGVVSRKSETGEEMMVPYDDLSEPCKELDRMTVRTVFQALGDVWRNAHNETAKQLGCPPLKD